MEYHENLKLMGTTRRHMEILSFIEKFFIDRHLKRELMVGREQIGLVKNKEQLIDVSVLSPSQQKIVLDNINQLKLVYPDIMIFKDNASLINFNNTRVAGIPDLVIEVWSEFNTISEREEKRKLFQTSKSEFWEIQQNSIKIICWKQNGEEYEQFLDKPVVTPWGEVLDLYPLSVDARDFEPNDKYHGGEDIGISIDF
jgi:hypothetical protein